MRRSVILVAAALAACSSAQSSNTTDIAPEPVATPVRVAPADQPITPGDCVEARRRIAENPGMVVDRIPAPLSAKPPALQKVPRTALRKDGSAEIKVDILVDTLGKADMKTFTVVPASNAWWT